MSDVRKSAFRRIENAKNLLLLHLIILWLAPEMIAKAQEVSSTASISVTIVNPIQLTNVRDMDFGIIAAGETSGTVILEPSAASIRTKTGDVTLPSGSGTVHSAKFIISGTNGFGYSILLPSAAITLSNGAQFMIMDNFTSMPSGSGVFISGTQSLYVGATLHVNAHQEPGNYKTTNDFEVIVNYN